MQADLNLPLVVVISIVSAILLAEVVIVAQAYVENRQQAEIVERQISQPAWELTGLLATQQAELNSYRWIDQSNQRVSIPIDLAIERFVQKEAQQAATRPG